MATGREGYGIGVGLSPFSCLFLLGNSKVFCAPSTPSEPLLFKQRFGPTQLPFPRTFIWSCFVPYLKCEVTSAYSSQKIIYLRYISVNLL